MSETQTPAAPGLGAETEDSLFQGGQREGDTPAGEQPATTDGTVPAAGSSAWEAEKKQLLEQMQNLESLRDLIESDQSLKNAVLAKIQGVRPEAQEDDFAEVEKELAETFEPEVAKGLSKVFRKALEKAVTTAVGKVEPRVRQVDRLVAGSQFERALAQHGIHPEAQDTPAFEALVREQRANRTFRQLEQSDPRYAAEILATAWKAKTGTRESQLAERQRVEAAKSGSLHRATPRGTAGQTETVKVRPNDLMAIFSAYRKGLKRENLDFSSE